MKYIHLIISKRLKYSLFLLLGFCALISQGQNISNEVNFKSVRPKAKKKDSITFTSHDYKIISLARDTTFIDTTLTIHKDYLHNPTNKDMFEYMPFSNMGQTYNSLGYNFRKGDTRPELGATANRFYFITPQEVPYFYLPTPITEFSYKTGMEQGQYLHTLFSANISPNINMFIRYNAMRSLGDYQNILSSIGNFIGGLSYLSKNKQYWLFTHYAFQDIERQENGGLSQREQFDSGNEQFLNRGGVDVAFTDASSEMISKRFFLHHQYNFIRNKKVINTQILLKHQLEYDTKFYSFNQNSVAPESYFGQSYIPTELYDKSRLKTFTNNLGAELVLPYFGKTYVYGKSYFYNYFFKNIIYDANGNKIPHQINSTEYGLGFSWKKLYKGFSVEASGEQMFIGTLLGTELLAKAGYKLNEFNDLSVGFRLRSAMPNFNFLLYQSDYKQYNWYKTNELDRENYQTLFADIRTKWANASLDITNINNYTYFNLKPKTDDLPQQSSPTQYTGNIQYLKLKISKDFQFGKFGFDNTLMYQQVIQNQNILNIPTFTTRNTFYYSDDWFKKAMYVQTGITLKYFTSYYANRYNPLLAEFEVQTHEKIGNYPLFDFFFNAKVRTMRIYLKAEHFNSSLFKRNYYSAPLQPYRDFSLRFGITWNFFS